MQNNLLRRRTLWLVGGSIIVLLYNWLSDPEGGALTAAMLGQLTTPVIAVWFAYLARKALFDYFDLESIVQKARESTVGSGIVFLGVCLVFYGLLGLFGNQVRAETIPPQALLHVPTLKAELDKEWPTHPKELYLQD